MLFIDFIIDGKAQKAHQCKKKLPSDSLHVEYSFILKTDNPNHFYDHDATEFLIKLKLNRTRRLIRNRLMI